MGSRRVEFPETGFEPLELPDGSNLIDGLTIDNSPVLFGCCSGVCGTCLIEVETNGGEVDPAREEEQETLEIYAEGNSKARLACQLRLTADLKIKKINPI